MSITFRPYDYSGTNGDAVAIDSTGAWEVTVSMAPPPRNERMGPGQKREQENKQRLADAVKTFGDFINSPQAQNIQVGSEISINGAKIKKIK